jgi:hypothetical protein
MSSSKKSYVIDNYQLSHSARVSDTLPPSESMEVDSTTSTLLRFHVANVREQIAHAQFAQYDQLILSFDASSPSTDTGVQFALVDDGWSSKWCVVNGFSISSSVLHKTH